MNRHLLFISLLLFTLLPFSSIQAQSPSPTTKGTDFWVGFMPNLISPELFVYIGSDVNTTGTISVPDSSWLINFSVNAGDTLIIPVPDSLAYVNTSQTVERRGVHITSKDSVYVYSLNTGSASTDATVVLPSNTLGRDYLVSTYAEPSGFSHLTLFLIIAASDSTDIVITPSVTTFSNSPANVPIFIKMDAGDTYLVAAQGDLSGSHVRSLTVGGQRADFALFVGNTCTNVGPCTFCDHLYQQQYPTKTWAKEFVLPTFLSKTADVFRFFAAENGTRVDLNTGGTINLNAGEFFDTTLNAAAYAHANKPIQVTQLSRGQNCDSIVGDPFMIALSPTFQRLNSLSFQAFNNNRVDEFYLNVITHANDIDSIRLDGLPMGASAFTLSPINPDYAYSRQVLGGGGHTLESDSGFIAYVYGYGQVDSYGYAAGASLVDMTAEYDVLYEGNRTIYYAFNELICTDDTVNFEARYSSNITNISWVIDTASYLGETASHAFPQEGVFDVWMIYTRPDGCLDTLITTIDVFCSVLMPEPQSLKAYPLSDQIVLNWQAEMLPAIENFELERSFNGIDFETIGELAAKYEQEEGVETYEWIDKEVAPLTTYYYRIRQNHTDGSASFSAVVQAQIDQNRPFTVEAFYELQENVYEASIIAEEAAQINLRVVTLDGKEVLKHHQQLQKGANRFQLNAENLAAALYIIEFRVEENTWTQKLWAKD